MTCGATAAGRFCSLPRPDFLPCSGETRCGPRRRRSCFRSSMSLPRASSRAGGSTRSRATCRRSTAAPGACVSTGSSSSRSISRYDQLLALPRAEQVSDFHCVTGWSVDNVHWAGVRLRDLLAAVRPTPDAEALTFVSAEHPYSDSLTLDQALLPDVMLAYEMDGEPLTRPHGAPVRLVIPEMYGYKGVKWVEQITLAARTRGGLLGTARLGTGRVDRRQAWIARRYVRRFSRTERALHWVHASAFFVLLGSGLVLYLPSLSEWVGHRPVVKGGAHLHRDRLGSRACARHPRGRPARAAQDDARARQLRCRRSALAETRPGAAGTLQCGPEGECGSDGGVRRALRRLGLLPLARRTRRPVSLGQARSSSTTG